MAHKGLSNHLAALVDLVDRVPDELLRLGVEDFTNLRLAVAAIRNQIEEWRIRVSAKPPDTRPIFVDTQPARRHRARVEWGFSSRWRVRVGAVGH